MDRLVLPAILAILLTASTGCTTMSDVGTGMTKTMRMLRPQPFDGTDEPSENADDSWSDMVKEGRPNREPEREPDRFWWNNIMSPQARSIERNLGFE